MLFLARNLALLENARSAWQRQEAEVKKAKGKEERLSRNRKQKPGDTGERGLRSTAGGG